MAPIEDGGGSSEPERPSAEAASVDPGQLGSFASYVDSWAEALANQSAAPMDMVMAERGDYYYPEFGVFGGGEALTQVYDQSRQSMATSFDELYGALVGLAKATRKVAEKYSSTEELNNAGVAEVTAILQENIQTTGSPNGQDPSASDPSQTDPSGPQP